MQSDRDVHLSCVEMIVGRIKLCTCSTVDTYSVYTSDVARLHTRTCMYTQAGEDCQQRPHSNRRNEKILR